MKLCDARLGGGPRGARSIAAPNRPGIKYEQAFRRRRLYKLMQIILPDSAPFYTIWDNHS
jgi:hypothetical protein